MLKKCLCTAVIVLLLVSYSAAPLLLAVKGRLVGAVGCRQQSFLTRGVPESFCCCKRHLFLGLQLGGVHIRYLEMVRASYSGGDLRQEERGIGISAYHQREKVFLRGLS